MMADVHEPSVRSYNMSRIRSRDTKPEMIISQFLRQNRFKFEDHAADLPGKPDFVFRRRRRVIFVNGCFWHGHHGCKYFVVPKTRRTWWLKKIAANRSRDARNVQKLVRDGWKVLTIFECRLKQKSRQHTLERRVLKFLRTPRLGKQNT